jgi:hypothetical protein
MISIKRVNQWQELAVTRVVDDGDLADSAFYGDATFTGLGTIVNSH